MGVLFPSDSQRNAEVLADAFAQKQVWDLRWYRFKLIAWVSATFGTTALSLSAIEHYTDWNLWAWIFGL